MYERVPSILTGWMASTVPNLTTCAWRVSLRE
jgi:hypothetical protein